MKNNDYKHYENLKTLFCPRFAIYTWIEQTLMQPGLETRKAVFLNVN